MRLGAVELAHLAEHAIAAARAAGEHLSHARPQEIEHKPGAPTLASQVVTEVDRRCEQLILRALRPTLDRFELALLTEEREDDRERLSRDYFWCIDPLDGTLPFIEGQPGYAVSIALVARDGTPWIGVVYDPVEGTLYHAIRGHGLARNGEPWTIAAPTAGAVLSLFVDRSFMELDDHEPIVAALRRIARELGLGALEIHPPGGAVMNACRVLAHAPACYFKRPKPHGGGSLWDFGATACLFHAAGAIATDIHGHPLELNRAASTFMGHRGVLFASDEGLAARIRASCAEASHGPAPSGDD